MGVATTVAPGRRTAPPMGTHLRDGLLVALAVSSGAVDAISWLGLGKVFSAFMTGNLAFVGFGVGGADGPPVGRTLVALAAFAVGAAIAARVVRTAEADRPWPPRVVAALALSLALQVLFLAVWLSVDADPSTLVGDLLVALSSLAMGMQTIAIFSLGVRASFTTAATATIAVLMGDLAGWASARAERLRLVALLAAIVAGAALGALLVDHARHWAPLLPIALTAAVVAVSRARDGRDPIVPSERRSDGRPSRAGR